MNIILWGFATALSGYFAYSILRQWLTKRKPSHLAWFIGFFFYFFSALGSTVSYFIGWEPSIYRIWYVAAASLVAFLGAGQLYFTVKPKVAHVFLVLVAIITVAMFVKVFNSPLNPEQLALNGEEIGGTALPRDARLYSPILTIPGSFALIIGSFYTFFRRHSKAGLWIGIGSLIIAMGGTLTRFGLTDILPIANSVGITLIFYGYSLAAKPTALPVNTPQAG
ncbi:hypothetical protein [Aneurinibacillus aneurinilyticus]|nr:hypothetical protein [Aneurinibacillus aneurinilyticus]MCI1694942.1 hypothetical protein [Aneurinibacillus aneurinilyticus]MED0670325.1 hypothetical protein [Aneurinibacillus aneurinilyticus]MED0707059.1 hypothetical protein [Aneurinibacillus aneurinilyticus]MED0723497.1 hypothetical protein [Aneurinibacillus aneurinilyticus]MED0732872.1 hypothetical protein [Aneurinibacillus aneurinilyticus]